MPLPFSIPRPVSENGTPTEKGNGYQWIVNKFVELCNHIADIKEQTKYETDKGEYRKLIASAKLNGSTGKLELNPVPVGVEWHVERIIGVSSGEGSSIIDVFQNDSTTYDQLLSTVAINQPSSLGFTGERGYAPDLVIRPGEELTFNIQSSIANVTVSVIVWLRVIAEKPQGLAVS